MHLEGLINAKLTYTLYNKENCALVFDWIKIIYPLLKGL